ncbi:MAG: CPBP family intramembrane glutamic endopeptidase [Polyangiales bacterium]
MTREDDDGLPSSVVRAPAHAVYVLRGPDGEGEPHLLTDLREVEWTTDTQVADKPEGRFVTVGDAIDNAPSIRDGLLSLSPDPSIERWRKLRALTVAAPVSWMMYVASEGKQVDELSKDAKHLLDSEAFKAAEQNPQTATAAKLRRTKIERAVSMRWTYTAVEGFLGIAALLIIIAGFRRLRAVPIAIGMGAGIFWLFHAGQPDKCFRSFREIILALLGFFGAIAAFALVPSETKIGKDLRERIGIGVPDLSKRMTRGDRDLLALLAAAWAGLSLPFLLNGLGKAGIPDLARATFFVGFCLAAFLGFLAWRKEESKIAPKLPMLALAAALGFGVTTACDVAARAALATVVEAQTCINPESAKKLKGVQEASAKETTAARKETQTQALAFWIAVLAAPLAEEMLYRGTLQRVARRRLGSRWAMLLSAGVFGVAHALAFPDAFYQHFGLGLAFAAVFELAGGGAVAVIASAATHAMWNGWLAAMPVF